MPEIPVPGPQFEKDIVEFQKAVERVQSNRESSQEHKDIVKRSLRETALVKPLPQGPADSVRTLPSVSLPAYLIDDASNTKAKVNVERLLSVALKEDLFKALALARKAEPFVEDAFHDALLDYLVPELKRRGVLK